MDPQLQPQLAPVILPGKESRGRNNLLFVLVAVLGAGTLLFAVLAIVAFNQAGTAKKTLEQQKKAAAEAARADQKKVDERAYEIASESPFRSYVAPLEYGSFEIKFPKNWSSSVDQNQNGANQVTLVVHPNFVRRENNIDDLVATKVQLQPKTLNEFLRPYDGQKKVKKKDVVVDDIKGVELTGEFGDKRVTRMVIVPIRDKVLVFTNEARIYAPEFDQILAQSKVIP